MKVHDFNNGERYVLFDDEMRLVRPVNDFLRTLSVKGLSENTIKAYARDLKCYYEFLNERHYTYEEFSFAVLGEYVEYLKAGCVNPASLFTVSKRTPETINRMLSTVSSFYKYLIQYGLVSRSAVFNVINTSANGYRGMFYHTRRNPGRSYSIFKLKEKPYSPHILSEKQIENLFLQLNNRRDKLLLSLLLFSGARISEALSLRIKDIPMPDSQSSIAVLRNIPSKGKHRDIYIPEFLVEEIDSFIMEDRIGIKTDHDYLFVTEHPYYGYKRISYSGLYSIFKKAGEKAGFDFRFHDTRHTYITNLVESGMDFSIVRLLAGHMHISTTQKYVTLNDEYIIKSLEDYWEKKPEYIL